MLNATVLERKENAFHLQQQMAAAHSEPQSRAGLSSTHQPRGGLEATGRGFCPAAAAEVW